MLQKRNKSINKKSKKFLDAQDFPFIKNLTTVDFIVNKSIKTFEFSRELTLVPKKLKQTVSKPKNPNF